MFVFVCRRVAAYIFISETCGTRYWREAEREGERERGRKGGRERGRDLDLECVRIGCKKRWRMGGKHYTNSYHNYLK